MPHLRGVVFAILLTLSVIQPLRADDPAAVPKGSVTHYTYTGSTIFPGTVRDYWVYIPKQYDGSKPACLYVNQDGVQFHAPEVFDRLIAAKEMPVTVAIFVSHGKVMPANDHALIRYNRSYEYDGLGDNYARFLLGEFLPTVEKELHLNISNDPNDRAIGGSSSGAVCAFTVAWERPDAFRRVFSAVGTYVGLRGANVYPTLIRKFEPKPLRIFLQDGSHDLNIYGGDWWMANQEMERALTFAGYEVNHDWGDGGHNGKHATRIFADAMRWLWKDWPTPIKAGLGSSQLQQILIPGENWQLVGQGYGSIGGMATNRSGEVLFNDSAASKTYKIDRDGKITVFRGDTHHSGGQRFGPDGRLYTVANQTKQLVAYDERGGATVITEGFYGKDLAVTHDGNIYVTEPPGDRKAAGVVWFIDPRGRKHVIDIGLECPSGVALSPDQSLLYVADARSHWVYSYQIQPDGSPAFKQRYFHLHAPDDADYAWPDGLRVDRDGRLYVATRMGVQVCDQVGRVNAIIPVPGGRVSNLCFGGAGFDTLYAAYGDKVYKRKLRVSGVRACDAPIKPASPHL